MKKNIFLFFSFSFFLFTNRTQAQTENDSISISITPYLLYRGHLAVFDREIELQDNVSRVGGKLEIKKGKISFLAATELRINLFQGGTSFNVDGNTSGKFLDIATSQAPQTFTNRIGYIGLDFEEYGTFTFGKQWSVYYDVTSYTDKFFLFGARASATFIGGTDGGQTGTGRADQSMIYRNKIGKFYIGLQTELRGGSNNKAIDGYGFSTQYEITENFKAGIAFNRALLNNSLIDDGKVIGLKGQPTYYSAGLNYQGEKLALSLVGAIQKNGDFVQGSSVNSNQQLVQPTVVFDAKGIEFYSKYDFGSFSFKAGYNLYVPDVKAIDKENNQELLSSKFEVNDVILGLIYQPNRFIKFYGDQRISFGRNALDVKDKSVFAIGMIVDLTKTFKTKVAIDKKS